MHHGYARRRALPQYRGNAGRKARHLHEFWGDNLHARPCAFMQREKPACRGAARYETSPPPRCAEDHCEARHWGRTIVVHVGRDPRTISAGRAGGAAHFCGGRVIRAVRAPGCTATTTNRRWLTARFPSPGTAPPGKTVGLPPPRARRVQFTIFSKRAIRSI